MSVKVGEFYPITLHLKRMEFIFYMKHENQGIIFHLLCSRVQFEGSHREENGVY